MLYTFSPRSFESHGFRSEKNTTHQQFPQTELVLCCASVTSERGILSCCEYSSSSYTSL